MGDTREVPVQRREPVPGTPLQHSRIESLVRNLIATERHEDAVLVAQALLDARTEAVLVHVANFSEDPATASATLQSLPAYNLLDAQVQAFLKQVARIDVNACCQDELEALKRHVALRYGVVHHAELVSPAEAEMSLAAVLAISQKVRSLALSALDDMR